jgi:hypothetical protein
MLHPNKIAGRLGNQLFQIAYLSSQAKKLGRDRYFQDLDLFDEMEEEVKLLFKVGIEPIDMVAVHIRRGDYVGHPLYVDLTLTDYYDKAMKEFIDADFLVFSDDIKWAKEYFADRDDVEFCEEEDPVKALNLMAGCKGVIMANSTFSWWAGRLSTGKVIAPKQWFKNGDTINLLDIWQKI